MIRIYIYARTGTSAGDQDETQVFYLPLSCLDRTALLSRNMVELVFDRSLFQA